MPSKTYSAKGDDKETSFATDHAWGSSEGHHNEHVCKDHNIQWIWILLHYIWSILLRHIFLTRPLSFHHLCPTDKNRVHSLLASKDWRTERITYGRVVHQFQMSRGSSSSLGTSKWRFAGVEGVRYDSTGKRFVVCWKCKMMSERTGRCDRTCCQRLRIVENAE